MLQFAPHERRCFQSRAFNPSIFLVCSARAEMFLIVAMKMLSSCGLLRTSGDVSAYTWSLGNAGGFAPHERRCFFAFLNFQQKHKVCSARAEMFLTDIWMRAIMFRLLRTSGDVSDDRLLESELTEFAPHERRCFHA